MNRPLAHGPAIDPPAAVRHRKLVEWVRDGTISDVKTIIGTFWLEKILRGEWTPDRS